MPSPPDQFLRPTGDGRESAGKRHKTLRLIDYSAALALSPEEAGTYFGPLAMFAGLDMPASSAKTQAELGWKPTEIGLIADIGKLGYFKV